MAIRETRKARESIYHRESDTRRDESSDFRARKGGILIAPGRRPRWHEEMLVKECLRKADGCDELSTRLSN